MSSDMHTNQILKESEEYFKANPYAISTIRDILLHRHTVSLRLLEWVCTNYDNEKAKSIRASYRREISQFGKKLFDPFRRAHKISAWGLETSIGQLNFLKWVLHTGILQWVVDNVEEIKEDIRIFTSDRRRNPREKNRKLTVRHIRPVVSKVDVVVVIDL
jgi:hypothetical protein